MIAISESRATNATKIADELGVTKGAVSQTLTRLEKKGVLVKTKDASNKNELSLQFTEPRRPTYRKPCVRLPGSPFPGRTLPLSRQGPPPRLN